MIRDNTESLSGRQEKALVALLTATSIEAAAEATGVTKNTLYRWIREDPLFQVEYREARRAALDGAIAQLQLVAAEAVETLRESLKARDNNVKVRAASKLLDSAFKAHETFDIDVRLKALEEASRDGSSW
jgi:transposase-like protein